MQLRLRMNVDGPGRHGGGEVNFGFHQVKEIGIILERQFGPRIRRLFLRISFQRRRRHRRQRMGFCGEQSISDVEGDGVG